VRALQLIPHRGQVGLQSAYSFIILAAAPVPGAPDPPRRSFLLERFDARLHPERQGLGERADCQPVHHVGTMHFDRAEADIQPPASILFGMPAISPRSTSCSRAVSTAIRSCARRLRPAFSPRSFSSWKGAVEASDQHAFLERLFQKVDRAKLHRTHRHRNFAVAGHHDHGQSI
jgi:hypothetical protein